MSRASTERRRSGRSLRASFTPVTPTSAAGDRAARVHGGDHHDFAPTASVAPTIATVTFDNPLGSVALMNTVIESLGER